MRGGEWSAGVPAGHDTKREAPDPSPCAGMKEVPLRGVDSWPAGTPALHLQPRHRLVEIQDRARHRRVRGEIER